MKSLLVTFVVVVVLVADVTAQTHRESGIYFGAIAGTKISSFDRQFAADIDPQFYSFSIGAGSAWTNGRYVAGVQFLYSSGTNSNRSGEMQYTGFENALTLGYNIADKSRWSIEPNAGIVLSNNQLIVQDTDSGSFQNLINNQVAATFGVNVKLIDQNGLFTGMRLGYQLPLSGETEWINKVSDRSSGLKDNIGAFYVQLNIGGFLSLVSAN